MCYKKNAKDNPTWEQEISCLEIGGYWKAAEEEVETLEQKLKEKNGWKWFLQLWFFFPKDFQIEMSASWKLPLEVIDMWKALIPLTLLVLL